MGRNISFAPRDSAAIFLWHRDTFPVVMKGLKEAFLHFIFPITFFCVCVSSTAKSANFQRTEGEKILGEKKKNHTQETWI